MKLRKADGHTAWRAWRLNRHGQLTSTYTNPWPWPDTTLTARCDFHDMTQRHWRMANCPTPAPHTSPGAHCWCGIRAFPDLDDLLDAIETRPRNLGLDAQEFDSLIRDRRTKDGSLHYPDVIGMVRYWGKVEPGRSSRLHDPPGTARVQYARVGPTLYVGAHTRRARGKQALAALAETYKATLVHSECPPAEWLDEIRDAA